ncbi:WbqC family protein [Nocardia sp. NPDC051052]|uniref:WbqC family protein n=1 Tax=Nocardia sp. NPDC051052 TaxID=3364322 RepID=UPI0037A91293
MTPLRVLSAHQPSYLPYPGLINKILQSDVFVIMDNAQYVKGEWHNRNRIRTQDSFRWLTIPVHSHLGWAINQVKPTTAEWLGRHERIVNEHYRRSPFLAKGDAMWSALREVSDQNLGTIGWTSTFALMEALGCPVTAEVRYASDLQGEDEVFDKRWTLQRWCDRTGCNAYLTGRGGLNYLNPTDWRSESSPRLLTAEFRPVRYRQMYPGWVPDLSALDLLFCVAEPRSYLISRKER